MTSDEEPDGDSSEATDGGSSSPQSEGTSQSESRFDEFLDRLDEREAARNRSNGDSDERPARTNTEAEVRTETTVEAKPEIDAEQPTETATQDTETEVERETRATAEAKAEADEWIWGSPKEHNRPREATEAPKRDSRSDENSKSPSDEEVIDRIEELSRVSERDDERIGHVINDETVETAENPSTAESDSSEDGEITTASESSHPTGSPERPGKDDEKRTESEDRWEKLGTNLSPREERSTEGSTSRQTASVEPTEAIPSDEPTSEVRTNAEITSTVSEPSWGEETTDGATVSEYRAPSAEGALSGGDHSSLDRAISAGSVLVLGPTGRPISEAVCSKFLVGEQGSRDVLFVTFDESPDDRVDVCHRSEEWTGGEIGIIEVGRGSRSASAAAEITGGEGGSITVRHVSKPGDLSKLGIVITQLLAEFDETPRQTVLCFHTLSALHSQVGTKTLFRFLNTLQGRLRSANAVGHYHMDPDLHDEIVIETLRPIFDGIVRYTADGEIEIE